MKTWKVWWLIIVRIGVALSAAPAFAMSIRNRLRPSVFFFTSPIGVVRAISRYMCEWL